MSNDDVIDVDASGQVIPPDRPRLGGPMPGAGRPPGAKVNPLKTKAFREWVDAFFEKRFDKIERWIDEVGDGKPSQVIPPDPENGIAGGVIPGLDPNPAKAVDLILQLAEYAVPKQARMVLANDPTNPFSTPVLNVTIGGKKVDYQNGGTTPSDKPEGDGD